MRSRTTKYLNAKVFSFTRDSFAGDNSCTNIIWIVRWAGTGKGMDLPHYETKCLFFLGHYSFPSAFYRGKTKIFCENNKTVE